MQDPPFHNQMATTADTADAPVETNAGDRTLPQGAVEVERTAHSPLAVPWRSRAAKHGGPHSPPPQDFQGRPSDSPDNGDDADA